MIKIISIFMVLINLFSPVFTIEKTENFDEYFRYVNYVENVNFELDQIVNNIEDVVEMVKNYCVQKNKEVEFYGTTNNLTVVNVEDTKIYISKNDNYLTLNGIIESNNKFVLFVFSSGISLLSTNYDGYKILNDLIGSNDELKIINKKEPDIKILDNDVSVYKLLRYCTNNGYKPYYYDLYSSFDEFNGNGFFINTNTSGYTIIRTSYLNPNEYTPKGTNQKIYIFNNLTIISDLEIWENIGDYICY